MKVIYEDNHIIIVNKQAGEIVQGDKTGDRTLADDVKAYIKEKYAKPGDVFLGVVHRLDRPVSGVVVFARTSKALSRLNDMFRTGKIQKTYQAIVPATEKSVTTPDGEWVTVDTWLTRNERQNKAFSHQREVAGSKRAVLDYRIIGRGDRYNLLEVRLHTGRHHQIRCQLSSLACPSRETSNTVRRAAIPMAVSRSTHATLPSSILSATRQSTSPPIIPTTNYGWLWGAAISRQPPACLAFQEKTINNKSEYKYAFII